MAKTNCGTCDSRGYNAEHHNNPHRPPHPDAKFCNRGCTCNKKGGFYIGPNGETILGSELVEMVGGIPSNSWVSNNGYTYIPATYSCKQKRAPQNKDRYLNAGGFLGTGVSGFKVIWWSLGALLLLSVVGKGVRIYKQSKY